MAQLGAALSTNTILQTIDMRKNEIGDPGGKVIAEALGTSFPSQTVSPTLFHHTVHHTIIKKKKIMRQEGRDAPHQGSPSTSKIVQPLVFRR